MLLLIIEAGGRRYGVAATRVVEVVPVPALRTLPESPPFIAGVFSNHGTFVPVIDLSMLLTKRPSRQWLSTRILLLRSQLSRTAEPVLVGLMAEHVTDTLECQREEFQSVGVPGSGKPYAGGVRICADGFIQELDVDGLLTSCVDGQFLQEHV